MSSFLNSFAQTNLIKVLLKYGKVLLLEGSYYTLLLSAITVLFGVLIGTLLAMSKMSKIGPLRFIANVYIEIIRGTPSLLQIYLFYFMLPKVVPFLNLSKFACIAVALTVNSSAYVSEIIRSGIQAVDRGQTEAAQSLGLSKSMVMSKIVLPQAVKNILPALGNEFVMVIKETALASTFFVGDLMSAYKTVSGATYLVFEPLILVGIVYLIMTFTISKVVAAFERRMRQGD